MSNAHSNQVAQEIYVLLCHSLSVGEEQLAKPRNAREIESSTLICQPKRQQSQSKSTPEGYLPERQSNPLTNHSLSTLCRAMCKKPQVNERKEKLQACHQSSFPCVKRNSSSKRKHHQYASPCEKQRKLEKIEEKSLTMHAIVLPQ